MELLGARRRTAATGRRGCRRRRARCTGTTRRASARQLRRVALAPVDRAGRLLHEQPRLAAAERAHEVALHRGVGRRVRIGGVGVGVVGDDVDLLRPLPVVGGLEEPHEVRRDRDRRDTPDDRHLGAVALQQLVGAEAVEVEQLGRVLEGRRRTRRQDLARTPRSAATRTPFPTRRSAPRSCRTCVRATTGTRPPTRRSSSGSRGSRIRC